MSKMLMMSLSRKNQKNATAPLKRPENIPREVWGLHADKGGLPSLIPTEQGPTYKQPRFQNNLGRLSNWKWTPFKNSARTDGAVFYHWRRVPLNPEEKEEDYSFAKFNKKPEMPSFSDEEYTKHLESSSWSKEETSYLLEQLQRFDLRFIIVQDRWNKEKYPQRSLEDIKERYFNILRILDKIHGKNLSQDFLYDAAHERLRREQLARLYARSIDEVKEEERLVIELKKIELRKKEREKKTQDLQKLISQADSLTMSRDASGTDIRNMDRRGGPMTPGIRKRPAGSSTALQAGGSGSVLLAQRLELLKLKSAIKPNEWEGLKFTDITKNPGVYLRSQKMKLPSNLGQKKVKLIESFLEYMQIDPNPPSTEEIAEAFNELRSDVLLLNELRTACNHCDYELQSMRLKHQQLAPGKPLPACLQSSPFPAGPLDSAIQSAVRSVEAKRPKLSGSHATPGGGSASGTTTNSAGGTPSGTAGDTPFRKQRRAAALEQPQVLKRLKIKN